MKYEFTKCEPLHQRFTSGKWEGCPFCMDAEGSEPRFCRWGSSLSVRLIDEDYICPLANKDNPGSPIDTSATWGGSVKFETVKVATIGNEGHFTKEKKHDR